MTDIKDPLPEYYIQDPHTRMFFNVDLSEYENLKRIYKEVITVTMPSSPSKFFIIGVLPKPAQESPRISSVNNLFK